MQNNKSLVSTMMILAAVVSLAAGCGKFGKKTTETKFTSGKPFPAIKLLYNTSEGHKKIAEAIRQMWKDELGIEVELQNAEWKSYLKNLESLDYNISRAGWIGDYMDPNTFLDMWMTGDGNNQTGYSNPEYDKLIKNAGKELDPAKRMQILSQAEDMLINKDMPIIPIYTYVNSNILRPNVRGIEFNMRDIHPLKYVYMEKDGKPAPVEQQIFRFNNGTEPETLDPGLMTGSPEFNVAMQLFEGLAQYDPKTLDAIPGVAKSWDVSKDGKTYTYHLRKDCKWSNGDPVTAKDFEYSWLRVLNPKTASKYANMLYYLKNGRAFNDGKIKDASQVGVKAVDDYTLKVELENPTAYWTGITAFQTLLPVNKKCVEKFGDRWTRAENIVTNGPFLMKTWTPKDKIIIVKNPDYADSAGIQLQKIEISALEDNVTALQQYEANETDWVRTIPLSHVDKYKGKPETHITPFLATYYYRINVTKPPLDNVLVRKALNLAINKKAICERITKAGQMPASTIVPPGISAYTSPKGPDYDPDEARKLLQEAGYAVKIK